jgi:hypothetical protein
MPTISPARMRKSRSSRTQAAENFSTVMRVAVPGFGGRGGKRSPVSRPTIRRTSPSASIPASDWSAVTPPSFSTVTWSQSACTSLRRWEM